LDGSEWARVVHGHLGGRPPAVDLAAEARLAAVMRRAAREGLVSAAHDLSEGGLAQALVEMCVISECGAAAALRCDADPFVALFSESTARILLAVPDSAVAALTARCQEIGQSWTVLGTVTPDDLTL